jgi:hypothetical protein
MIHLADQIFVLGPSYMHYMYPYERHMIVMKGYVCNHACPEGSMIEGYTTEEVVECYTYYIKDGKPIGVPVSRHHGRLSMTEPPRGGVHRQDQLERFSVKREHNQHT